MENKKKKSISRSSIILFAIGLCLILFPLISQTAYFIASHKQINDFEKEVRSITTEEVEHRIQLAHAYNETIEKEGRGIKDPYTNIQKEGRTEYARMLKVHEKIGYVEIPSINTKVPIYAGSNEEVLQKGAGHLEGTSLPVGGLNTHTVITAHRGLPTANLFTDLDKVKRGDVFYVRNIKETLAYKVISIEVVEPTELDRVAIEEGKDYATLLTCTPYMINSHRLLVKGERISFEESEAQEQGNIFENSFVRLLLGTLAFLIIVFIFIYRRFKKRTT